MSTHSRTILVLTNDAGLGHRQAALATVAALEQRYGAHCRPVLVNPLEEPDAPRTLRNLQSDFNSIVRFAPALYQFAHDIGNMWASTRLMERLEVQSLAQPLGHILDRERPDVVVTTHPAFVYLLVHYRQLHGATWPIVVLVTDLARLQRLWFRPEVDLYLVPTGEAAELARRRGIDPRRVHVTGIPVDPRVSEPRPMPAILRAGYGWDTERTTVLAVGSRRVHEFPAFLRALNNANLPIQLAVVTGDDAELLAQVKAINWRLPVHLYGFVHDFAERALAADAVVTKAGGLTVAETLAVGRPLFIIQSIPMHEQGNADYVVANSAGVRAESPAALAKALREALQDDGRFLAAMTENARLLGRPRAAFDVADLIWAQIEQRLPSAYPVA